MDSARNRRNYPRLGDRRFINILMKDFHDFRQKLDESAWTDALNDLQVFWNKNAEQFVNQSTPLWPIFSRPVDRIVRGGVLILGINPGSPKGAAERARKDLLDKFSGPQPPVFDPKSRKWYNVDFDKTTNDLHQKFEVREQQEKEHDRDQTKN